MGILDVDVGVSNGGSSSGENNGRNRGDAMEIDDWNLW